MNRIQRTRKKGAKLPPNTLVVTRPTKWGNPYKAPNESRRDESVILFKEWLFYSDNKELVDEFINMCKTKNIQNIACFCAVDSVCHGDVWLEVWEDYKKKEEE